MGRSSRPLALTLMLAGILGGCVSARNTPQQDYVCEPDGRYTVRGAANSVPSPKLPYFDCMREQFAAKPYGQWLRQRSAIPALTPSPRVVADPATPPIPRPTWNVGDEWSYRWESPIGKGTFVWVVDRFDAIDGIDAIVVRSGNREIFYRRADGAHILDKVDGAIVIRNAPPVTLIAFPFQAGSAWTLEYTRERPVARQTDAMLLDCRAGPAETVTVPAGTFSASHVSCVHRLGGALGFEVWYAPEVGNSAKERTVFSYGIRERELVGFKSAAPLRARD